MVVIGLEPNWTARLASGIAASGKPVASFSIEGSGGLTTIERASRASATSRRSATRSSTRPWRWPRRPPAAGHFMDTSSAAAESGTLFAAGGGRCTCSTGQGNIIGNPVVPVVKLTANPHTAATMSEHIDLDVSEVITADMTLDDAADATEALVVQAAAGRWTAAEVLGHREFVLTRPHRTA